jgi:hypothetical protein
MPRFVWSSGPENGNMAVTMAYGLDWRVDVPQEVDEELAIRIRRNRFFREEVSLDLDGDGEVSKAELIAEARRRGLDANGRHSVATLRAMLAESAKG